MQSNELCWVVIVEDQHVSECKYGSRNVGSETLRGVIELPGLPNIILIAEQIYVCLDRLQESKEAVGKTKMIMMMAFPKSNSGSGGAESNGVSRGVGGVIVQPIQLEGDYIVRQGAELVPYTPGTVVCGEQYGDLRE
jgi:hypothetical protein